MQKNTVAIHSILKKKLQSKIFNQLNIKKLKFTKIILGKKANKKKGKKIKSAKKSKTNKKVTKKKEMHCGLLL